uniref:Inner membrane protein n=1 Tax=Parastrongyloides trichosuri TaxID=131310 RepID=A0A0N4ZIR5_PARTI
MIYESNYLNDYSPMIKRNFCPKNYEDNIKDSYIKSYGATEVMKQTPYVSQDEKPYVISPKQNLKSKCINFENNKISCYQQLDRKYSFDSNNISNKKSLSETKVAKSNNKTNCCSKSLFFKPYNMTNNHYKNHNNISKNKYTETNSRYRNYNTKNYYCCCGNVHVVLGAKLFLVLYIGLTFLGIWYGAKSTAVWMFIPIFVISSSIYGFYKQRHKYIYPFLIISIVQIIACLIMSIVVVTFSIINYGTLQNIVVTSEYIPLTKEDITDSTIVIIVGLLVGICCFMSLVHVWQCMVIYSCLEFFESINNSEWLNAYQSEIIYKSSNDITNPYHESYHIDMISKNMNEEQ